jgi:glycosyltransferase involved in cell wall biosynthesis
MPIINNSVSGTYFMAPVSVIVLTLNEEANIEYCLRSVHGWSDDIHVVDSFSVDNTVKIAAKYTRNILKVEEAHWADLRNWAMRNLELKYKWLLFLDADEQLTKDLKMEISKVLKTSPKENGYYIKRRFIFMGRWLKHGGMYDKILRLFRHEFAEYLPKGDVEYAKVKGKVGLMRYDIIHEDRKGIYNWLQKHNKISDRVAKLYLTGRVSLFKEQEKGSEIEGGRRTWIKYALWEKVPLILRPCVTFLYQYFLKFGFLDGLEGLSYHLLQAFWYRLVIYVKIRELNLRTEELYQGSQDRGKAGGCLSH